MRRHPGKYKNHDPKEIAKNLETISAKPLEEKKKEPEKPKQPSLL